MKTMTDLDLPEAHRTQANFWKAKYFEARRELVRANKGIRRLRHKLDRHLTPAAPDGEGRCKCIFTEWSHQNYPWAHDKNCPEYRPR